MHAQSGRTSSSAFYLVVWREGNDPSSILAIPDIDIHLQTRKGIIDITSTSTSTSTLHVAGPSTIEPFMTPTASQGRPPFLSLLPLLPETD